MGKWKEISLGDLIDVKHGFAFKGEFFQTEPNNIILTTPGNFKIGGGWKEDKCKYYNGDIPEDYILKGGELVVTMTDLSKEVDTLGYSAIIPKKAEKTYLHNQRIGLVEFINNEIDNNYLYWLMRDKEYRWHIVSSASGSTVSHTSPTRIKEYEFLLPPLPEQKVIASVLSSLDDKIDLLHRQNKTLEAMAETLFRQSFVEEAREDWEEKPLSFFGNIICGKTPSKKIHSYFNGKIPFIKIPDMHGNIFLFETADSLTEEGKQSQANKTLPPKSICISCIATVGLVSMNAKVSQTNQQINSIIPKENYYRYFLYLIMKAYNDLLHSMASGGTATLNLNTGNFSKIPVPYPGDKFLVDFQVQVEPFFDKIFTNQSQIRTLEKLRDTLLPKLMSCEVRVMM